MYTLIVQALLSLESYAQECTWGNKLIKIPQVRMKMASFWRKIQKNSVIKGDSYSQLFKGTSIKKKIRCDQE